MVPPYSHRVPRVRRYSGYDRLLRFFAYRALTLFGMLSHTFRLNLFIPFVVLTPGILLLPVWPLPRSLATTGGISFDFSSSPYLDVSVQAVPHIYLCIQYMLTGHDSSRVSPFGHPRIITPAFDSPWLFVDRYVLLRLPVPRHPPCALLSLTISLVSLLFSQQLELCSLSS